MNFTQNGMVKTCSTLKNTKTYDFYKIKDNKITDHYIYRYNVSPFINKFECDICYESKGDWLVINKCKHKMCYKCFNNIVYHHFNNINELTTNEQYTNYMIKNSFIKCPFCRAEFSFMVTSHYIKSKLSVKIREVVERCKEKRENGHKNIKSI